MIISEKQALILMHFVSQYRGALIDLNNKKLLTHEGQKQLDQINDILSKILNQQPDELKEIK